MTGEEILRSMSEDDATNALRALLAAHAGDTEEAVSALGTVSKEGCDLLIDLLKLEMGMNGYEDSP